MARDSHTVHMSIKAVELFISKNARCSKSRNDQYVLMCNHIASLATSPVRGFVVCLFPPGLMALWLAAEMMEALTEEMKFTFVVSAIPPVRSPATQFQVLVRGPHCPFSRFSVLRLSSHRPGHPHWAPNPYSPSLPSTSEFQGVGAHVLFFKT